MHRAAPPFHRADKDRFRGHPAAPSDENEIGEEHTCPLGISACGKEGLHRPAIPAKSYSDRAARRAQRLPRVGHMLMRVLLAVGALRTKPGWVW